jgi:hypothetical protein
MESLPWPSIINEQSEKRLQSDLGRWERAEEQATKQAQPLEEETPLLPLNLQTDLGRWAQVQVEAEHLNLQSDLGRWAKVQVEAVAPLNLQSDLGRWAQTQAETEYAAMSDLPSSFCLRPLQSDLGQRCRAVVDSETWLEKRIYEKLGELREYMVRSDLLECHVDGGLAFRRSKRLEDRDECFPGPSWGSMIAGYHSGDGWVQVGNRFLPMSINGVQVLHEKSTSHENAPACEQSVSDGPALTADGRAIDLDGGAPIYFACSEDSVTSRSAKLIAKQVARSAKALKVQNEASDRIERGDVITVDEFGVLGQSLSSSCVSSSVEKLKFRQRRHRLRQQRNRTNTGQAGQVLMVCPDGRVRIHLGLRDMTGFIRSQHRRQQLGRQLKGMTTASDVLVVDSAGCVRDEESDSWVFG